MAKKLNINPEAYREVKIETVNKNPENSIVYIFENPIVRNRFSKLLRTMSFIKNATIDLWGVKLDNEDKNRIEENLGKVKAKAKEIIELAKEKGCDVNYHILSTKKVRDKISLIKQKDSPLVEVFVAEDEFDDALFEALFLIDKCDKEIKRSDIAEKWINLLNEYEELLKTTRENVYNIFKEKIRAADLLGYPNLRNDFRNFLKTTAQNNSQNS